MNHPNSMDSANDNGNKSEDNASNENIVTPSCRDDGEIELMPTLTFDEMMMMNEEEEDFEEEEEDDDDDDGETVEDEEEDSDNNDHERYGEDLLLALGEGGSEQRNDLLDKSDDKNAPPSKFNLSFLQKTQENSTGLDIHNLKSQLSKLDEFGTSESAANNTRTCLFLNNIYQTLLLENLTKLRQKLAENQEKQEALVEKIKQTQKADTIRSRKNVFCIPYFHLNSTEPSPNAHTKILQTWHAERIIRERSWTNKDHEDLVDAVHENVWEMTLKPFLQRLEVYSIKMMALEDEEEKNEYELKIEDTNLEMEIAQQRDINEIIAGIDDEKIDWMKISNLTFNGKHSEFSCKLMWKNWLHPKLNKSPWTQKETKKLKELVEKHGRHEWELIADKLGTNRTPFHCLQHYRRKLDIQVQRLWTEEEDKILKEVIEMCRIGEYIPWNQVSFYMEGRSSDACGKRWSHINPTVKRGKWTPEEDKLLLAGVNVLGTNGWNRIQKLIPGRSAGQCRDRWIRCLDPHIKTEAFTYDEDKLLLENVQEHGYNWALIACKIEGRTDSACRRQFAKLKKWEKNQDYVLKQSDESKTFFLNDFDPKHFADLIEKEQKTLEELFPVVPFKNDVETLFQNQAEILKRDLVRQELDRRKGEIFVPRPLILRKYSNNSVVRMWEERKRMRKTIELFIQKRLVRTNYKSPKKNLKAYTMISPKLDKLKPNTSVTEMLEIARSIRLLPKPNSSMSNKRHLCAAVDKRIQSLLYMDWLRENMKGKPKLTTNKSKASCEEEKFLDRLEGMTLLMTVLGLDQGLVKKRLTCDPSHGPLQCMTFMNDKEMQNFREEFLLISKDPHRSVNFSGNIEPNVTIANTIPPNIHTLSALRLLFQDKKNLQKSAEQYDSLQKKQKPNAEKSNEFLTLAEKMENIKYSQWYNLLRSHFRSIFMWPALLSTLKKPRKFDVKKTDSKKQGKKNRYPLSAKVSRLSLRRRIQRIPRNSMKNNKEQSSKPCEENNSSGITTPSVAPSPPSEVQVSKKRGRPVGAATKNKKVWDSVPQRTSSRQKQKKARLDTNISASEQTDQETPSTSKSPETTKVGPEWASMETKDLLVNVSPDLIQKVISQEVHVKRVGTYIGAPISVTNDDIPPQLD